MKTDPSSTGDCYQAARNTLFELWLRRERGDPGVKDVHLVHGTIVPSHGDASGRRIDHAWVELNGDTVVERSNGNDITMGKDEYCRLLQAVEDARYTLEETYREMSGANHFGPWHK